MIASRVCGAVTPETVAVRVRRKDSLSSTTLSSMIVMFNGTLETSGKMEKLLIGNMKSASD